mmetsp:Transcript_37953/g.113379  ORF Transcript_37953/g.113379 Transcript_37953/m.113379 type:complete len:232 (-) Transcript_37953:497-1192(-)
MLLLHYFSPGRQRDDIESCVRLRYPARRFKCDARSRAKVPEINIIRLLFPSKKNMSAALSFWLLLRQVATTLPKTLHPCQKSQEGLTLRVRRHLMAIPTMFSPEYSNNLTVQMTMPKTRGEFTVLKAEAKASLERALQAEANISWEEEYSALAEGRAVRDEKETALAGAGDVRAVTGKGHAERAKGHIVTAEECAARAKERAARAKGQAERAEEREETMEGHVRVQFNEKS